MFVVLEELNTLFNNIGLYRFVVLSSPSRERMLANTRIDSCAWGESEKLWVSCLAQVHTLQKLSCLFEVLAVLPQMDNI